MSRPMVGTLALGLALAAGCGEADGPDDGWSICQPGSSGFNGCSDCTCVEGRWSCPQTRCSGLGFKAGFEELEPVSFQLRLGDDQASYTSSPTRLFWIFQPAAEAPEDKPLAVLFNGGPGASTSGLLFSFNTAARSLDPERNGGVPVGDNPAAWTRFANLLYIDARGSGFSYGLMPNPQNPIVRHSEFSTKNYNCFLDGADFVRVILRFLQLHPELEANPVLIVGESFGGVRATVSLHLLLHYPDYAGGQAVYQDPALAAEIQAHFERLHPEYHGQPVPAELIAEQFSRQVLIQPLLSGVEEGAVKAEMWEQPGSVIFQIAQAEGLTFVPCSEQGPDCWPVQNALGFVYDQAGRDTYHYGMPRDWTIETGDAISANLLVADNLSAATGIDVTTLGRLAAAGRGDAYRIGDPEQLAADGSSAARSRFGQLGQALEGDGDFAQALGGLPEWDAYHVFLSDYVFIGFRSDDAFRFSIHHGDSRYGEMFLQNAARVETFLTDAAYDLRVYSPAQPAALARHQGLLVDAEHDDQPRPGVARPGWLELRYQPGASGVEGVDQRTIRNPHYPDAGHVVEISQPLELRDDIEAWLTAGDQG